MHKKYYVIAFIILLVVAYAQEEGWSDDQIQNKKPEDIINDPVNARQHWQSLSAEQKEEVYQSQEGLKKFSDLFASEKGIKNIILNEGSPSYDGLNLINGNTRIPISGLANAEVTSLRDGGFKIKFPDNSDLSNLDFSGGTNGISFEGKDLRFRQGSLSSGIVTMFDSNHLRIGPNSVLTANNVEFTTQSKSFDLFYGQKLKQDHSIQIYNDQMSVVGDDIKVKFLGGNQFNKLSVDGKITVVNGGVELEFDGKGETEQKLPLGSPISKLVINDENALDKVYYLNPEDYGFLEGFGGCDSTGIAGYSTFDVTGKLSYIEKSEQACDGKYVVTGENTKTKYFFRAYTTKLELNEEQAKKAYDKFIEVHGRAPDVSNKEDLKKIGALINEQVDEMKFTQTFHVDHSLSEAEATKQITNFLEKSGISVSSLTAEEKKQLGAFYSLTHGRINKKDAIEYYVNEDQGSISIYKLNGAYDKIDMSGRVVKAIIQNYYDESINKVPGQSKDLLKDYFGKKRR